MEQGQNYWRQAVIADQAVWSILTKLDGKSRDLAMFNLAIDSKLRGCDVVRIKVEDSLLAA